jgi:hypothetical protein
MAVIFEGCGEPLEDDSAKVDGVFLTVGQKHGSVRTWYFESKYVLLYYVRLLASKNQFLALSQLSPPFHVAAVTNADQRLMKDNGLQVYYSSSEGTQESNFSSPRPFMSRLLQTRTKDS